MSPVTAGRQHPSDRLADLAERSNLTRAQLLMWLGQELDPDVPLYNMIQTFRIGGAVDPAAFAIAWRELVRRSDALRTTLAADDGVPQQIVRAEIDATIEVVDFRSAPDPAVAAEHWIAARKVRPLVLSERLWDTALIQLGTDESLWYLCQHHLITDGQAFALTFRAVAGYYGLTLESRLDEAPVLPAYRDYISYERQSRASTATAKAMEYWRAKAARATPATSFYGRTVAGRTARTDRLIVELGHVRSARIRAIARTPAFGSLSDDLSLHTIWATLVFAALHRITGESTLRIGTPFLGRPSNAFRSAIGLFIEIGALDVDVRLDDTFVTLASRVQRELVQGAVHARPGISSAALNRSYDVLLNSVTSRFDRFAGYPVTTEWVHTGYGDRDHALRLQVSDFDGSGSFRLHFDVNTDVLGAAERRWLLEQVEAVVDRFIEAPDRHLGAFDLLTAGQRAHQIERFNDTATPYPRESTVVDLFQAHVGQTPTAVAVQSGGETRSYAQLDADANRVAGCLSQLGVGPHALVAIALPRSVDAVVAILGVLKAGGAYVPIDPSYPAERRRLIAETAQPTAVITTSEGPSASDYACPVVTIADAVAGRGLTAPRAVARGPESLAYVIFTSGSTGRPKGAMLTHGGLTNYLWWARSQYLDSTALDFPLYSSLSFDLTITSLFLPLITGGRLVVYDRSRHGEGLEVLDVFEDDLVDVVKLTPAHLSLVCEHQTTSRRIRRLILGGENLRVDLAREAQRLFPGAAIFNEYGPTETVVGCMVHRFDPERDTGASVPIGRPAANTRIHVVDRYGQPVPPGVSGEMVVGGDGVARGYVRDPELTAARFFADTSRPDLRWYRTGDLARWGADGGLEFLGRADQQVKIRGARVELGDVEAALLAHPGIVAATVQVVSPADRSRRCTRCGLSSRYPDASIDDSGVCADCRAYAEHRDQVARYFRSPEELGSTLREVRRRAADRPYDCLVLVSGGKDSTYMLYQLVRDYGVRPLAFTLDNGYISAEALDNVRAACTDLHVDLHVASTPHMRAIFADSLRRHANVCNGCFKTIYTLSMRLARERGIDTIVTGLSRGQLFETRLADTFAAREFDPDVIDAWILEARQAYHRIDDSIYQLLDADLFANEAIFHQVRFIDFYRFVDVGLDELYRYLATHTVWRKPSDTGRSTNCLINDVGIYVHTRTRGFHNYALPYSWDVRLGHKTRDAALHELDDDIDLGRVRRILEEVGFPDPPVDLTADKRLAAYYVARDELSAPDVHAHLAARLPAFMMPAHVVPIRELPLTPNGKVDRAALPDPRRTRTGRAATSATPTTPTERQLAAIWSDVLRVADVGIRDNFFDLGGDSIASIRIVAAARRLGLSLSARDLFAHQTIADLTAVVGSGAVESRSSSPRAGSSSSSRSFASSSSEADLDPAVRERIAQLLAPQGGWDGVEDVYPLTPTQLGMLYHSLRSGDPATYFGQGTCTFASAIDAERFREAWQTVCRRHPATRVRFIWSGLDRPLQVVRRDVAFPWERHDWRARDADDVAAAFDHLLHGYREAGLDLDGPALMSFALVETASGTHFVWNSHHAVLDGWAAHLLFDEVLNEYESGSSDTAGTPTSPPFRDHVVWQAARDTDAAERWWRHYLSGIDAATPIPLAAPAAAGGRGHASRARSIDAVVSARVLACARERRLTLSTVANGAWAIVLSHYSGVRDVVIGSTVSGREDGLPGIEHMVGMLIATLPIRLTVDPTRHVGEWLTALQRDALDARSHGHVSLTAIQRVTSVPTSQPLFDSIVVVENYPTPQRSSSLLRSPLVIGAPSNYPLALLVHPPDSGRAGAPIVLEAVYDQTRFSSSDIERLLGHVEQTLAETVDRIDGTLGDVAIVTADEQSRVSAFGTGPTGTVPPGLVHDWIAGHAARRPDTIAVASTDGTLTYAQLDASSTRLAVRLQALGIGKGHCVGLVAVGSRRTMVGLQAILKAGAAYVPIDPDAPAVRWAHVVRETNMGVALVDGARERPDGLPLTWIDLSTLPLDEASHAAPAGRPGPDDLAYVIYTSGSTGAPKGVMVSHRNIAQSTAARVDFYGDSVPSFLLLSSMVFDSSLVGIFWTLCSGGTLVIPPADRRHDIAFLGHAVERHSVTHLLALPSLYGVLLDETPAQRLGTLRTVIVAGETCPAALVGLHRSRCPHATLVNEYGPTEGTVWSHAFRVSDTFDQDVVPIGAPIPNSWCRVLDQFGHLAPIGIAGELVIGGPGIAAGYIAREDLTAQAFRRLPASLGAPPDRVVYHTGDLVRWQDDGQLVFLGRRDRQVKVRGYRIELDEVERALLDCPGVRTAAAAVTGGQAGTPHGRLVTFYCADRDVDEGTCRAVIAARLPRYMLPELVRLDEMPTTATGKADRVALAALLATRRTTVAAPREPMDDIERQLATIWSDVLGRASVGVDESFFDLGGTSLDAMRLFAQIERRMGQSLRLSTLFDVPTVAGLATLLRRPADAASSAAPLASTEQPLRADSAAATRRSALVLIHRGSGRRPLFCVHGAGGNLLMFRTLTDRLDADQTVYGFEAAGVDGVAEPAPSIEAMAGQYLDDLRQAQPHGPYLLSGYSGGGVTALEMAHQLVAHGEQVDLIVLLDTFHPSTRARKLGAADHLAGVAAEGLGYVPRRLRARVQRRWTTLRRGVQLRGYSRRGERVPPDLREERLVRHFAALAQRYTPRPYDGDVTLFRARDVHRIFAHVGPRLGWDEAMLPRLRVVEIPGDHDTVFKAPHIDVLAAGVSELLHRVAATRREAGR